MLTSLPGSGLGSAVPGQVGAGFLIPRVTAFTVAKCKLYMRLRDMEGVPIAGARVVVSTQKSEDMTTYIGALEKRTLETNDQGYFELSVIRGTVVKILCKYVREKEFVVSTVGLTSVNLADFCG